jgi:uncharacterized protein (UPF0332 family)
VPLSAAEHQSWAQRNKAFYNHIGGSHSEWPDWAMSVLFYAAVHEIQAALVVSGSRPRDHTERMAMLREKWPSLGTLYDTLFTRSKQARYLCHRPSQAELALAEAALTQVRGEIAKLNLPPY